MPVKIKKTIFNILYIYTTSSFLPHPKVRTPVPEDMRLSILEEDFLDYITICSFFFFHMCKKVRVEKKVFENGQILTI